VDDAGASRDETVDGFEVTIEVERTSCTDRDVAGSGTAAGYGVVSKELQRAALDRCVAAVGIERVAQLEDARADLGEGQFAGARILEDAAEAAAVVVAADGERGVAGSGVIDGAGAGQTVDRVVEAIQVECAVDHHVAEDRTAWDGIGSAELQL